ncbi:hypothetical protein ACVJF0_000322 [Bradyrhizobium elkanii]
MRRSTCSAGAPRGNEEMIVATAKSLIRLGLVKA